MSNQLFHRYYLPTLPKHEDGWSVVFLDQIKCIISIVSDWGNFTYTWGRGGSIFPDFRQELLRYGDHYLIDKLSDHQNKKLNIEKTKKNVREKICYNRRHGYLTAKDARKDWNALKDVGLVWELSDFLVESSEAYCDTGIWEPANLLHLEQWVSKSWPRLKLLLQEDIKNNPL